MESEMILFFAGLSCDDPGEVYGAYKTGGLLYEDIMTYTCLPGYNMTRGDANLSCQADQTWKGIKPTCASKYFLIHYSKYRSCIARITNVITYVPI